MLGRIFSHSRGHWRLVGLITGLCTLLMSSSVVLAQDQPAWQHTAKDLPETAGVQASSAMLANTVTIQSDAELGRIEADARGMTLYYLTSDAPPDVACIDMCPRTWPPMIVNDVPTGPGEIAGQLGTMQRLDGSVQAAFNGWPLYFFFEDQNLGDTKGHNITDDWGHWRAVRLDVLEATGSGAASAAPSVPTDSSGGVAAPGSYTPPASSGASTVPSAPAPAPAAPVTPAPASAPAPYRY